MDALLILVKCQVSEGEIDRNQRDDIQLTLQEKVKVRVMASSRAIQDLDAAFEIAFFVQNKELIP